MRLTLLPGAALLLACCTGGPNAAVQPELRVGQVALAGGSPEIALRIGTELLRRAPNDTAALDLQGESLTALGRATEAEAAFRRALTLDPGSAAARLGLGRLALAQDPRAAELLFLEVLTREPRNAVALNDLGIARDLQGHHDAAQAAYRRALGVAPDMQAAIVNLSLSLALGGQAQRGVDLLRPLVASPGASPRVRHDFALVSELAGDRPAAEAALAPELSAQQVQEVLHGYDELSVPPR